MHHVVATGQLTSEYPPGYMGVMRRYHNPQVPILSPTDGNLRVLFAARLSTECKSVFERSSSSSFSFASQQQLFGIAASATHHRHWTSRLFFTQPRTKVADVIATVIVLNHTLAKISDDAGAFILRSLVSASQRRRQLTPATGVHRGK